MIHTEVSGTLQRLENNKPHLLFWLILKFPKIRVYLISFWISIEKYEHHF